MNTQDEILEMTEREFFEMIAYIAAASVRKILEDVAANYEREHP